MSRLSCGIVGLPNVGKSTLFNALTAKGAESANYPFCTIDPNVGVVPVPDPRLETLAELSKSKKIIPAVMEFVDIAGLVKGASKGEGLGNQFLSHIRETDAIIQVVRCFEDPDVVHVHGQTDPIADLEVIELELILADLQMAENAHVKLVRQAKGDKKLQPRVTALEGAIAHLNEDRPLRTFEARDELSLPFLTAKRILYVANVAEGEPLDNPYVQRLREHVGEAQLIPLCAKLEEELAQLEREEQKVFLETLGLQEAALDRLIRSAYSLLGLITFLTTGEQETRAWTIPQGSTAQEAAGQIHTDIQKGFIRAEVVDFETFVACRGRIGARESGKARSEGKGYIVKDGDVILFFHS